MRDVGWCEIFSEVSFLESLVFLGFGSLLRCILLSYFQSWWTLSSRFQQDWFLPTHPRSHNHNVQRSLGRRVLGPTSQHNPPHSTILIWRWWWWWCDCASAIIMFYNGRPRGETEVRAGEISSFHLLRFSWARERFHHRGSSPVPAKWRYFTYK